MALSASAPAAHPARMSEGLPARVLLLEPDGTARVDLLGSIHQVSLALMSERIEPGDWVTVEPGFAVDRIAETDAIETIHLLRLLEAAGEDVLTPV